MQPDEERRAGGLIALASPAFSGIQTARYSRSKGNTRVTPQVTDYQSVLAELAKMASLATRCDFCGRPFTAQAWNCRTCVPCAAAGAPDQGALLFHPYLRQLGIRRRAASGKPARGRRATSPGKRPNGAQERREPSRMRRKSRP